ncbi:TRASH domain-containing protein [Halorussus sp. MSC15.2]|nr:TRASH domain-containing protein [Halorussus sp. MSC15.2]NEU55488.1 TRASH domain-containing protein [Halorussus sp. MSC15.2]
MAECFVCGGRVHEYEEITTTRSGESYYFCCDEHREEFERTPGAFLS